MKRSLHIASNHPAYEGHFPGHPLLPGVVDGAFFMPDETDPDGVTRLMAFVVAPTLTPAQVTAALRERIDAAFLPRPIVMLDRLPRQLTGKLPREELKKLARSARG